MKKIISFIRNESRSITLKREYFLIKNVLLAMTKDIKKERMVGDKKIRWWAFIIIYSLSVVSTVVCWLSYVVLFALIFCVDLLIFVYKLCFVIPNFIILGIFEAILSNAERSRGLMNKIILK